MTSIVIVSADLLGDIPARLQQAGHIVITFPDLDSLNAWLAEKQAAVMLPDTAAVDKLTAQPPVKKPETIKLAENQPSHWLVRPAKLELTTPTSKAIPLTHSECCILRTAANAGGHPVTRKMLIESMGQNFLHYDERRLEAHISRLRRKIASHGQEAFQVRGVRGHGYLFTVELREIAG